MRRRRISKSKPNVSLFPFLAVLVCTMGALIVLLVLMVQQARVQAEGVAETVAVETDAGALEAVRVRAEDWKWRREILAQQRDELRGQLADQRLQLGHVEDHLRRLEQRSRRLAAEVRQLRQVGTQSADATAAMQAEREQLRREIAAAREQRDAVQAEVADRPPRFAVIPYDGPNGTRRRPIYLECLADRIVIQPYGVELASRDFSGPLDAGNPLDASLRAVREHFARLGDTEVHGEPYPLLIVRPGGEFSYAVARRAMQAWDDEFGYELVGAEAELEYPGGDPAVKRLLLQAIRDARQRQAILAAAMPSRFQHRGAGAGGTAPRGRGAYQGGPAAGRSTAATAHASTGGTGARAPAGGGGRSDQPDAGEAQADGDRSPREDATGAGESDRAGRASTASSGAPGGTGGGQGRSATPGGASFSVQPQGRDWALPERPAPKATAYSVPIRIVCLADRFIILRGQRDGRPPAVIPTPDGVQPVLPSFVKAIHDHMKVWDLAPTGGYWKPVLEVELRDAASAARFAELQSLLENSGLEVERKIR